MNQEFPPPAAEAGPPDDAVQEAEATGIAVTPAPVPGALSAVPEPEVPDAAKSQTPDAAPATGAPVGGSESAPSEVAPVLESAEAAEAEPAETPEAVSAPELDTPDTAQEPGPAAAEPRSAAPDVAPEPAVTAPRPPDEASLRLAEALVFSSAEPVSPRSLQRLLPDNIDAEAVLAALRERYNGRGVELVEAADGVMFRTAPDLASQLRKVIEAPRRLPRVAMETLAIVAYHQPMTRPEIEHIRGAALSQQTLDALLELNLIAPKGRRETPGRPTLWGTTPEFLAHFGLKDIRELPRREDLLLEPIPPRPETVTPDLRTPVENEAVAATAGGTPESPPAD